MKVHFIDIDQVFAKKKKTFLTERYVILLSRLLKLNIWRNNFNLGIPPTPIRSKSAAEERRKTEIEETGSDSGQRLSGPTFGENHPVEWSVELNVDSHVGLLALNLEMLYLGHVGGG